MLLLLCKFLEHLGEFLHLEHRCISAYCTPFKRGGLQHLYNIQKSWPCPPMIFFWSSYALAPPRPPSPLPAHPQPVWAENLSCSFITTTFGREVPVNARNGDILSFDPTHRPSITNALRSWLVSTRPLPSTPRGSLLLSKIFLANLGCL